MKSLVTLKKSASNAQRSLSREYKTINNSLEIANGFSNYFTTTATKTKQNVKYS